MKTFIILAFLLLQFALQAASLPTADLDSNNTHSDTIASRGLIGKFPGGEYECTTNINSPMLDYIRQGATYLDNLASMRLCTVQQGTGNHCSRTVYRSGVGIAVCGFEGSTMLCSRVSEGARIILSFCEQHGRAEGNLIFYDSYPMWIGVYNA